MAEGPEEISNERNVARRDAPMLFKFSIAVFHIFEKKLG